VEKRKTKPSKTDKLGSIGKQFGVSTESALRKKRKAPWVGFAEKGTWNEKVRGDE